MFSVSLIKTCHRLNILKLADFHSPISVNLMLTTRLILCTLLFNFWHDWVILTLESILNWCFLLNIYSCIFKYWYISSDKLKGEVGWILSLMFEGRELGDKGGCTTLSLLCINGPQTLVCPGGEPWQDQHGRRGTCVKRVKDRIFI